MAGVNKVILIGNLGKDPDIVVFDGIKKATFSLATNESYKNKDGQKVEQTEWHNIVCWNNIAENAEKVLKKGMQIYLEGKIRSRQWDDKEGNKKYFVDIIADTFTILSKSNNSQNDTNRINNAEINLSSIINELPEGDDLGDLPF
ncbi:MAG: single-stranded DNA-binding protein [Bacteroidales bacterium]|nr:single-stranded DNA-binding protein [Bacteroidales bacterium]MDD4684672.1 single-stranded DNA-binding protein [Bacteroidales bacterium]